jgi:membrane fusion protein, copper/silver efflux system
MAGKWICPMHPSVVKPQAGQCDLCGMDLVTTESLGYVAADAPSEPPLVIPDTAPLVTGKRAVVYVKKAGTEAPTFEGREIELGPKAGSYYIVASGLQEGEEVVTNGNFKIDSALQIQARPSMMNPQGGVTAPSHPHEGHASSQSAATETASIVQTTCPVMEGNPINKDIFVDYKGKRVYFCCKGCDKKFMENPEKYLDKLPQFREQSSEPNVGRRH